MAAIPQNYLTHKISEISKIVSKVFNQGVLPGEKIFDVVGLSGQNFSHSHVCQATNQMLNLDKNIDIDLAFLNML